MSNWTLVQWRVGELDLHVEATFSNGGWQSLTRGEVSSVWARHAAPEIGHLSFNMSATASRLSTPRAERHTLERRLGQADSLSAPADSMRAALGN